MESVSITIFVGCSGPDMDRTISLLQSNNFVVISSGNCLSLASTKGTITRGVCRHRIFFGDVLVGTNIRRRATRRRTYQVRRSVDSSAFLGVGSCCNG